MSLISGSGCPCPGDYLIFECRVEGGEATVWKIGDCGKEIKLRHSEYLSKDGQVGRECNSVGWSVGVENNSESIYISRLNVSINNDLISRRVGCYKFSSRSSNKELVDDIAGIL